jgi:hypothetical protein
MKYLILFIVLLNLSIKSQTLITSNPEESFPLVSDGKTAAIYFDNNDFAVVGIASRHLSNDIFNVSGKKPVITNSDKTLSSYMLIIGTAGKSKLVDQLIRDNKINATKWLDKWEAHSIQVIEKPLKNVNKALVIVGNDRRGTAYAVFELSKQIGVSPWYWWADVPVAKKENIFIKDGIYNFGPPSVKYRGIFINDEDWGLKPWASETFDPEQKDIGPKTYAKVCELLLRLKANYLWPAMHECTSAFNQIPANKLVADSFAIVMGSAHCEPLLFNNATEWNKETMGEWNYQTNKKNIQKVLDKRVKENGSYENIYTIAMRGIHDRAMLGSLRIEERVRLLEKVAADQREILANHISKNIEEIPQIFIPYKEVLEIYENGLNLPEDINIVWPDDNYGYIKRLSNYEEQQRSGRSGVYYHISYLGIPHEYLWLNTTPPALIYEEMKKAYDTGGDRVWIANVGDIKPAEYGIQFFLDLGWNINNVDYETTNQHLEDWLGNIFGENYKKELTEIMQTYYRLGFIRKPEYMGWGYIWDTNFRKQKKTYDTDFSFADYREADKRIEEYDKISAQVKNIYRKIEPVLQPAFYQLVYYPVVGSALMNKKILIAQKNHWYAKQERAKTNELADLVKVYYDSLLTITEKYNQLLDGKWNKMMTVQQGRDAVYYKMRKLDTISLKDEAVPAIYVEEENNEQGINHYHLLPCFNSYYNKSYFIDIYNKGNQSFDWNAKPDKEWIKLSKTSGTVTDEVRIWVSVDWTKIPKANDLKGKISITVPGKEEEIFVSAINPEKPDKGELKGLFVEDNGYIIISPNHFNRKNEDDKIKFIEMPNIGIMGSSVLSFPPTAPSYENYDGTQPYLEYDFYTHQSGKFEIITFTLPAFPLNKQSNTRYGISIDDELPQLGESGTSDEWKGKWAENVLRNASIYRSVHTINEPGKHTLKFWVIDPGVVLQKIMIDFGGLKPSYTGPGETKWRDKQ